MKYLVQDGEKVKKVTMEGLEEIREGIPNIGDFEDHGTDYLADIVGKFDKKVVMNYKQGLGDKKMYGYRLVGFKDIEILREPSNNLVDLYPDGETIASFNEKPYVKERVFDKDLLTEWRSGFPVKDKEWVGYSFKDKVNVDKIILHQGKGSSVQMVSVHGPTDGEVWEEVGICDNLVPYKNILNIESGSHYTQWRLLAKTTPLNPTWSWNVYEIEMYEDISHTLIKLENKYCGYQDGEFIEVEPTEENFEQYSVSLMELLIPNEQGIKPLLTLENPEIVHLTDKPNPQLYIKGFRDLRPLMESDNPKLLISSEVEPEIRVTYHPEPQLVLPEDDIKLRMLDKIHDFTIYTNKNSGGDIKIVYSTDSGRTWEVYRDGKAEEVNIANIKEVKEKGLTPDEFNAIGEMWDEIVVDDKVRFAYYLETATINDIAEVDELVVEMDMHGRWRKAEHINDYDYEYDNEHIYVTFYKDGSYKVNYQG